jgi:excisionase family DNA binding protein
MGGKEPPERLTYTVEEAADALGISRAGAYEAVHRGEIPHLRSSRRSSPTRSVGTGTVSARSVVAGEPMAGSTWC